MVLPGSAYVFTKKTFRCISVAEALKYKKKYKRSKNEKLLTALELMVITQKHNELLLLKRLRSSFKLCVYVFFISCNFVAVCLLGPFPFEILCFINKSKKKKAPKYLQKAKNMAKKKKEFTIWVCFSFGIFLL